MAFGVTPTGFVIKPLADVSQDINDEQAANIGPGLDQDPRSILQQINLTHAAALAELWELGQAVYNAAYPDSASGDSLDNVSSLTGTLRSATTKTTIAAVSVTLNPNASLPAGSVAHLAGQPNARFLSVSGLAGSTVGGVFTVDFIAESAGAITVVGGDPPTGVPPFGQLDTIAEPVSGWTLVNNTVAGVTGEETESDAELRVKRLTELEAQGSTNVNSIRADLVRLTGVVDAVVLENDTDIVDPVTGAPAHSVYAILRGGTSSEIGQQIFESKAGGIQTFGAELETVVDTMSNDHDINFDFATELVFHADLTVQVNSVTFDVVQGPIDIKAAIAAYVNSLKIGEDVLYDSVKAALLPIVPGCGVVGVEKVTILKMDFLPVPVGVIDLVVASDEFASSDVANIDVTVL